MVKFNYIVLLLLFLFFNLHAATFRPFDFNNWNFEREVEEAYEASYEVVDGVLVNVDDQSKNLKAKKILKRISELEGYYRCLVNMIRDNIFLQVEDEFLREYGQYFDDDVFTETDNRFRQAIEIPMEEAFGKYRHRVLAFSNKTWIKNPDYTKLFIKLQLREIEFVENYIRQKLGINLGSKNGNSNASKQSGQRQPSSREPRESSPSGNQRYSSPRSGMRSDYFRRAGQRPARPSDMFEEDDDERSVVEDDDERLSSMGSMSRGYDEGLKRPRKSSPMQSGRQPSLRQSSPRQAGQRQPSPMQASPRQAGQRQPSPMQASPRLRNIRPSGIKQGNIRPSSTRPSRKRPGSDIRPNFVRPIVRPLGEKPVNFKSEYTEE
ncbi:hypothetical protein [Borrelia coriaceae]|nr:hypothetical protein [Borrelia coriaceae]